MTRVAIIGAGIGAQHLAGYRALPARFEVRTFCDLDADRARGVAGEDDSITVTDDLDAVLADPDIDLVDICLPPHLHFPVSVKVLTAGKHVVCEKPLVRSLAEADALIDVAQKAGRRVFPVFQYRYGKGTAQLRALMDAGLAGKPFAASLETHWNRGSDYYAVPWRGTWAGESGGAVLGHAIHNHDLLCSIFGPVAELSASVTTRVNEIEVEDCGAILMVHESGALSTSSITLGAAMDTTRLRFTFEGLTAESGTAPYAPAEGGWRFTARAPRDQAAIDQVLAGLPATLAGYAGYFDAIADALEGRGGREVTLEDGRQSIELVTAVYYAARTGQRVSLPLSRAAPLYESWLP
ncbi:Myo-inositol 2-dehydrogenase (plasmid) [Sinorhizobium sojae CCBAU 05684]|uniref:Myo-inositol 2-dehydrogenase n=1 Tax=Sinorhizobium sojae CCBAU 05684 TaxID=716928 RepID=A0A249PJM8_9HYPH|nr:Gfo/Idh/MocA family oxidoreductase [Sinorhizobium sojae]ASY66143.1 Myo-inositol 2-dehydrogenase [Sinorhizobium sojae CCBAU 05684]